MLTLAVCGFKNPSCTKLVYTCSLSLPLESKKCCALVSNTLPVPAFLSIHSTKSCHHRFLHFGWVSLCVLLSFLECALLLSVSPFYGVCLLLHILLQVAFFRPRIQAFTKPSEYERDMSAKYCCGVGSPSHLCLSLDSCVTEWNHQFHLQFHLHSSSPGLLRLPPRACPWLVVFFESQLPARPLPLVGRSPHKGCIDLGNSRGLPIPFHSSMFFSFCALCQIPCCALKKISFQSRAVLRSKIHVALPCSLGNCFVVAFITCSPSTGPCPSGWCLWLCYIQKIVCLFIFLWKTIFLRLGALCASLRVVSWWSAAFPDILFKSQALPLSKSFPTTAASRSHYPQQIT